METARTTAGKGAPHLGRGRRDATQNGHRRPPSGGPAASDARDGSRPTWTRGARALVSLGAFLLLASPGASQSTGNRAPSVVNQFLKLQPWAEPLGAKLVDGGTDFGSPWSEFYNKHYQGIARTQAADGTPHLILSRNRNPNKACVYSHLPSYSSQCYSYLPGELLVFEMSNLATSPAVDAAGKSYTAGERLGSNLLQPGVEMADTVPAEAEVKKILFDGTGGMPYSWHPGGMQVLDGVLAVPLACSCGDAESDLYLPPFGTQQDRCTNALPACDGLGNDGHGGRGALLFVDVEDPADPKPLAQVHLPGSPWYDGSVAIAEQGDGKYLVALLNGTGHRIDFFALDLGAGNELLPFLRHRKSIGQPVDASYFDHLLEWTDKKPDWDRDGDCESTGYDPETVDPDGSGNRLPWDCFQSISFVREDDSQDLFAILAANTTLRLEDGAGVNLAVLLHVDEAKVGNGDTSALSYVASRNLMATGDGIPPSGDFDAATGAYVSPSGQLMLYSSMHGADSVGTEHVVRMGEFRSLYSRYAHCGTAFHLHEDYAEYSPSPLVFEYFDDIFQPGGPTVEVEAILGAEPPLRLVAPPVSFVWPWLTLVGPQIADSQSPGMHLTIDLLRQLSDDFDDLGEFDSPDYLFSSTFDDDAVGYAFCGPSGATATTFRDAGYGGGTLKTLLGSGGLVRNAYEPAFDDDVSSVLLGWSIPGAYNRNGQPDLRYHWDFDNDGVFDSVTETNAVDFPFDHQPGTYIVRVRVADKQLFATVRILERDVYVPSLRVDIVGYGQVTSAPSGIHCAKSPTGTPPGWGACETSDPYPERVTLTATPLAGSTFAGWGGHCNSLGQVWLIFDVVCTATFTVPDYSLDVVKVGNGLVTSNPPGIGCGSDCSEVWPAGTEVTLSAVADPGWSFTGWTGSCADGQVVLGADTTCDAIFEETSFVLSLAVAGPGTVTSDLGSLSCAPDCSALVPIGATVQLTATPDPGAIFAGWGGDADCLDGVVTMAGPVSCTASFVADWPAGDVAWYPVDGTGEDIVSGFDGTFEGGVGYVDGVCSTGLAFDGTGAMRVEDAIPLGFGDFSVDFWIVTEQTTESSLLDKRTTIPAQRGIHVFLIDGKPGLQLSVANGYVNIFTPVTVADGQPHHVAITVDRDATNGGRIYVDDLVVAQFDPTGFPGPIDADVPLRVGRRSDAFAGNPGYFVGTLDELRFTGRALSPAEVHARYAAPCLRASWSFEGDLREPVTANDGTPVGSPDHGVGSWCRGLTLDGATSWVTVPDSRALAVGKFPETEASFSFWVRSTTTTPVPIFDNRDFSPNPFYVYGYHAYMANGKIGLQIADGTFNNFDAPPLVNDGAPHFVVIAIDRDRTDGGTIWIDGQLALTFDPTVRLGIIDPTNKPLLFGATPYGPELWDGMLDEVQVWSTALDAASIEALYRDRLFCGDFELGTFAGWALP